MKKMHPLSWLGKPFEAVERLSPRRQRAVHLALYLATWAATGAVGVLQDGWPGGLLYMAGLMAILTAHEAGHFLMARRHGIATSLPFFIPLPLPPFGTLGALIRMRGAIPHRKALLDVGAAGPLAGLAVAVPLIVLGVRLSPQVPLSSLGDAAVSLGNSLLFKGLAWLAVGPVSPNMDLVLHPLAYAGWVGLLVTAINLLPIGQLDGGHVVYALFRRRSPVVARVFHGGLVAVCLFAYVGWIVPVLLLAFFKAHPPTLHDAAPLDPMRRAVGLATLLFFILCFTPVPFGLGGGLIPMIRSALGW